MKDCQNPFKKLLIDKNKYRRTVAFCECSLPKKLLFLVLNTELSNETKCKTLLLGNIICLSFNETERQNSQTLFPVAIFVGCEHQDCDTAKDV